MSDIRIIRFMSILIMVGAATASYVTQRGLFIGPWKVDSYTASIAPVAVDLLAVICALALHRVGYSKVLPAMVLTVTGGASITANWIAGETVGSKCVHSGMVGLYLLAEMIASQKAKKLAAVAPVIVETVIVPDTAVELESPELPEAPQSPAIAPRPKTRQPQGPRNGDSYSERQERRIRTGK